MPKLALLLIGMLAAMSMPANAASPDAVKELAPSGRLRAAINFGNPVLAQKDPATGEAKGVSVALARELGRQLGVPADLVPFTEAGQVADAATRDGWDVAFLAIDPVRGAAIDFTASYVIIEGTYAVPTASPLRNAAEIDRTGVRVGVAKDSAYDLYLTRTLKQAEIVRGANTAASIALFEQGQADALAGVKQPLQAYVRAHPEARLVEGRFMEIEQAMCVPKGRPAGYRFVRDFIETTKASGFVAEALADSGRGDVTVAPAAP